MCGQWAGYLRSSSYGGMQLRQRDNGSYLARQEEGSSARGRLLQRGDLLRLLKASEDWLWLGFAKL